LLVKRFFFLLYAAFTPTHCTPTKLQPIRQITGNNHEENTTTTEVVKIHSIKAKMNLTKRKQHMLFNITRKNTRQKIKQAFITAVEKLSSK
jgi:hypothetical protein